MWTLNHLKVQVHGGVRQINLEVVLGPLHTIPRSYVKAAFPKAGGRILDRTHPEPISHSSAVARVR
jgi:hypothetical protein